MSSALSAVVINHDAGAHLTRCVASLRAAGVVEIVVVDNASSDGSLEALADADRTVGMLPTGRNLGYGTAANRGVARTSGAFVLICNPDLVVEPSAPAHLLAALEAHPEAAVVGPRIVDPLGRRYPSGRAFPSYGIAAAHALLGPFVPDNPWSRRYRLEDEERPPPVVDWVSGACMAVRRIAFESVGGFDEGYFMYVEDLDLCWRLRRAGWEVRYLDAAEVTHAQGVSTARHPLAMILAHHRSTWRFARRSASGTERALLPAVAGALALRLGIAVVQQLRPPSETDRGETETGLE